MIGTDGIEEIVEMELTAEEEAQFAHSCDVIRGYLKKAEELLDLWTAMEEKLSMLMQEIKESEVDIYEALGRILPIRLSLLTDLHLSIIGHASRAYIP